MTVQPRIMIPDWLQAELIHHCVPHWCIAAESSDGEVIVIAGLVVATRDDAVESFWELVEQLKADEGLEFSRGEWSLIGAGMRFGN